MSEALARTLADADWTTAVTVDDGVDVRVVAEGWPRLRSVYAAVRETTTGTGAVTVEGRRQTWRVSFDDGEVTGAERVGRGYTVTAPSRLERAVDGAEAVGRYAVAAGLLTVGVAVLRPTPLSVGAAGLVVVAGASLLVGASVADRFVRTPREEGRRRATQRREVATLPDPLRAAMVAVDDAKSARHESGTGGPGVASELAGVGFNAYLGALAYAAFGAWGLFAIGVLYGSYAVLGLVRMWFPFAGLDDLDDDRGLSAMADVTATVEADAVEVELRAFGDADESVFEGAAFAIPERGVIAVHRSYLRALRPDELRAILAHEYAHVRYHSPLTLWAVAALVPVLPGAVLLTGVSAPSVPVLAVALFGYYVAANAAIGGVLRRWESTADDIAAAATSPTALAMALNRIVDRHVLDGGRESLLDGPAVDPFGTHPFTGRRIGRLLDRRER